jgi:mRNA interferase RelE/StbE
VSYRLSISRRVGKQIGRLQPRDRNRVDAVILALENEPRPPNVEKISGSTNTWRVRVGDYRIVFAVDDEAQVVDIVSVAHRREVYRKL